MHKLGSVLENEMPKILWDFEIQTDHSIPARKPEIGLSNKRTQHLVDFAIPTNLRMKRK